MNTKLVSRESQGQHFDAFNIERESSCDFQPDGHPDRTPAAIVYPRRGHIFFNDTAARVSRFTGTRYSDGRPHEAVETEALKQTIIVEIVRSRLKELLPEPLDRILAREKRERVKVERALRRLR